MRNGRERNTGKRTEEAPASRGARDSGRGPDEARLLPADSGGARGVSTGLPRQGSPHASSQAGLGRSHRPRASSPFSHPARRPRGKERAAHLPQAEAAARRVVPARKRGPEVSGCRTGNAWGRRRGRRRPRPCLSPFLLRMRPWRAGLLDRSDPL